MNKDVALNWLYSLQRFGIKPGLERILKVLDYLGNPHRRIQSIHITGTNGKGTTAVNIASILKEANYKVGLYTSPHLVNFNERIQINGSLIPDDYLVEFAQDIRQVQERTNATFFELTTAMALLYFAENDIDFAVLEAGMGGQNDATNVVNPIISIITSIGLEHQEYLGDSLEKIAEDKSGIFKKGSLALVAENNHSELFPIFQKVANESKTTLFYLNNLCEISSIKYSQDFTTQFNLNTSNNKYALKTPFIGDHQARNIATSVVAIELLNKVFNISNQTIVKAIANARQNFVFDGRMQIKSLNPLVIYDVAHNPDAFRKLIATLQQINLISKINLCFAAMHDKDYALIANYIDGKFENIIITQPKIERAATSTDIAKHFFKSNIITTTSVCKAVKIINEQNLPILYAGSFYLIGEVIECMGN